MSNAQDRYNKIYGNNDRNDISGNSVNKDEHKKTILNEFKSVVEDETVIEECDKKETK